MQNPTPISISNWPTSDGWVIATAIGTCGAVIVALALALGPILYGILFGPKLRLLLQPHEIPDLDPMGSPDIKELWFHLIVKNTGRIAVKDCRASIVGLYDKNLNPLDINFKRTLPWSYGQVSDQRFTAYASFTDTLALDFIKVQIQIGDPRVVFVDWALTQHPLNSSKFSLARGSTNYCVIRLEHSSPPPFICKPPLQVIKVEYTAEDTVDIAKQDIITLRSPTMLPEFVKGLLRFSYPNKQELENILDLQERQQKQER
jgi:hypothetical protein